MTRKLQAQRPDGTTRLFWKELYRIQFRHNTKENGASVTPNSVKYHASKVQDKLEFPFYFRSLRPTVLENNTNIKEIQARLGHARISTTMDTYSHVTEKMSSETVDIFAKWCSIRRTDSAPS